ncbi:phage tail sheath family protein [Tropicimonas sp.]|uniref:phage tail sheath family protein n=1 Tax=Tropicimonas sp. TaxID=2067044 RepID=UPI003A84F16D
MVRVSYPGVYSAEKPGDVRMITGVATSISAFFGRTVKGPVDKPVRCQSHADFLRNVGGAHPQSEIGTSVKLFFDNGGTDCYVVRLAGAGAARAGIDLGNSAGIPVLRASARGAGEWGNGLRLRVDYNTPNPGESFNLTVSQEESGVEIASETHGALDMDPASPRFAPSFVSQNSALIELAPDGELNLSAGSFAGFSEARRPLGTDLAGVQATLDGLIGFGNPSGARDFEISVNGSAFVAVSLADWNVSDAGVGAISDLETQLRDRINDALSALVPAPTVVVSISPAAPPLNQHFLRLTAANGDTANVRVRRAAGSDIAGGLMMGVDNGGVEQARRSNFRPAQNGSVLRCSDDTGSLARLNTLAGMPQGNLTRIAIGSEAPVHLDTAPDNIQTTGAADPVLADNNGATSPNGNSDGVREKLAIIARAISNAPGSAWRAEVQGHDLVVLARSGTFNQIPASVAFAGGGAAAVNPAIRLNSRQYTLGPNGISAFARFNAATQTGADGGAPGYAEYVGDPVSRTGFHALDTVDLVNLLVLPADHDLSDATRRRLWGPASIYAQSRRAVLLLDAPDSWTDSEGRPAIVQATDDVNNLRATVVRDHAAVFYPRLRFNDRGDLREVGPTGAIAGLLARTDAARGVWKAPAGIEADLRNIVGLAVRLTDLENGVLNRLGVNCARGFPAGCVNWGARTMDGADDLGSEWKYLPVRRLALMIEESLHRGTRWVVFEPNDEPLWSKIRLDAGVFMNGLFRQGAFQGATPRQAYFVKCGNETTTQADRNLGIVNIEVGFAPLKPAEFVVITIRQIAGDPG